MLLESYRLEIFNSECNPAAMSVQCMAHLDQDVSAALPYLNASLGGFAYIPDPPAVTFRSQGKLITVHGRKIAVNALRDEAQARQIVEWLKREINAAWDNRAAIVPSTAAAPRPQVLAILKILPRTNCRACGVPTCLVFATRLAEGAAGPADCPPLAPEGRQALEDYLRPFHLET